MNDLIDLPDIVESMSYSSDSSSQLENFNDNVDETSNIPETDNGIEIPNHIKIPDGYICEEDRGQHYFKNIAVKGNIEVHFQTSPYFHIFVTANTTKDADMVTTRVVEGVLIIQPRKKALTEKPQEKNIIKKLMKLWFNHVDNSKNISDFRDSELLEPKIKAIVIIRGPEVSSAYVLGIGSLHLYDIKQQMPLTLRLKGSGDIFASGSIPKLSLKLNGAGSIKSNTLKCEQVIVHLTGSGNIDLHSCGSSSIALEGSGDITMHGSSFVDNKNIIGTGKVTAIND